MIATAIERAIDTALLAMLLDVALLAFLALAFVLAIAMLAENR